MRTHRQRTGNSRDHEYRLSTGLYGISTVGVMKKCLYMHLGKSGLESTCDDGFYGKVGSIITCGMIEIYRSLIASKIGDYSRG